MISSQNAKMLEILANSLHGKETQIESSEEWDLIYAQMCSQTVCALPAGMVHFWPKNESENNLKDNKPEKEADAERTRLNDYEKDVMETVSRFYKIMEAQNDVLALMHKANIPAVILKGAAAAANYPIPEYRSMGDVDLIVLPEDFERTFLLLKEAGYKTEENLEHYIRHIEFKTKYDQIAIELHKYFSMGKHKAQHKILNQRIYNGISNCQWTTVSEYEIPVLPKLENGLVLLAHIDQHLSEGLGLRQIIDWMCYVEKYLDDGFWQIEFQKAAEQIGLDKLAMVTTMMCSKYLGLQKKSITWFTKLDKNEWHLSEKLMEYILDHGNFGYKKIEQVAQINILRAFRNPLTFLKTAQQSGERNWKELKKYPWLYRIAWIYQMCHWAKKSITSRVGVTQIMILSDKEKQERELLENLGVTRFKKE